MNCSELALISLKKFARTVVPHLSRVRRADEQIKAVQFFPHFDGDLVAHDAGIFARLENG